MNKKKIIILIAPIFILAFLFLYFGLSKAIAVSIETGNNAAAYQPDLYLEDLRLDTISPEVGEQISFSAKIKNIGSASINQWSISQKSSLNEGESTGTYFSTIEAGQYANYTTSSTPIENWLSVGGFIVRANQGSGEYTFTVTLDPNNELAEADETNNAKTLSITVAPKASSINTNINFGVNINTNSSGSTIQNDSRIALWWGKVNMHRENGAWVTDPDGESGANVSKLQYCRKWYPNTKQVASQGNEYISGFKNAGNKGNYSGLTDIYLCLDRTDPNIPSVNDIDQKSIWSVNTNIPTNNNISTNTDTAADLETKPVNRMYFTILMIIGLFITIGAGFLIFWFYHSKDDFKK